MSSDLENFVNGDHTLSWHDHQALKKEATEKNIRQAMRKQASPLAQVGGFLANLGRAALKGIPLAATGATAAIGAEYMLRGHESLVGAFQKSRAFKTVLRKSPELAELPPERVKAQFDTLYGFSPAMARSPQVAASWLKQINAHTLEGQTFIPPEAVRDLVAIEKTIGDMQTRGLGRTVAQEAIKSLLGKAKPPSIELKPGTTLTVGQTFTA